MDGVDGGGLLARGLGVALLSRESVLGSRWSGLPKAEAELVEANTPDDFKAKGVGYLPLLQAPDEMIRCFSAKEGMWTKPWCEHDMVTLLGGLNGTVHFNGAGSVQYGAEPTAAIGQVLASDPSAECKVQNEEFTLQCERFEKALDRFSETIRPQTSKATAGPAESGAVCLLTGR
jgi:hypothetical protein